MASCHSNRRLRHGKSNDVTAVVSDSAALFYAGEPQPQSRYPTVAAKVGEICIVCGMPLSSGDIAIVLKGRRMPVMKDMAAVGSEESRNLFQKQASERCSVPGGFSSPAGSGAGRSQLGLVSGRALRSVRLDFRRPEWRRSRLKRPAAHFEFLSSVLVSACLAISTC